MKAKTADLPRDADRLLNVILLAFREKLPFGDNFTEDQFLASARVLLDVGAIRIMAEPDGRMRLGLKGKDFE